MAKAVDGTNTFDPDEIGITASSSLYDLGGHWRAADPLLSAISSDHRDLYVQAFALGSDSKDRIYCFPTRL